MFISLYQVSDQWRTSLWHFWFRLLTLRAVCRPKFGFSVKCIRRCGLSCGNPRQTQIKKDPSRVGNMKYIGIYRLLVPLGICTKGNMELPSTTHAQRCSIHSYQRPRPTLLFPRRNWRNSSPFLQWSNSMNKQGEIQICFLWQFT